MRETMSLMLTFQACSVSTRDGSRLLRSPTSRSRSGLLEAHRLGVVAGDALRVGVLVEPDFLGGGLLALGFLGEEEDVGLDAGVGIEDAARQADDGVEVALGEEGFFEAGFHPSPKRKPSGRTTAARPLFLVA